MKIIIRKPRPSDAEGYASMWNEGIRRKFFTYTGNNHLRLKKDLKKIRERYSSRNRSNIYFLALDTDKKIVVGSASFFGNERGRTRHRGELGWVVRPDYAGKGIGTKLVSAVLSEAKKRGFKRAEAEASVRNIPSIKLAKKFGFTKEGRKKKGLLLDDGRYSDTYLFGKILN